MFARLLVPFGIALSLSVMPSAVAQNSISSTSDEETIRALNKLELEAFLKKDPEAMARLWSDDFVVTNPLNKFVNRQQVLGMMRSGVLIITSYDRQIEYLRLYGDTAVVAGNETVVWGGRMPNAGKSDHLRFTAIWMKKGGRWEEVARHANIVPQI